MISRRHFDQSHGELKRQIDRIEVNLLVRDPGSARSADAYEGLRKAVISAAKERHQHLFQLAELSDAIDRGATIETLRDRAAEWSAQAGLIRVMVPDDPELFEITDGEGPALEVESPAWTDPAAGVIIKRGLARRTRHGTTTAEGSDHSIEVEPPRPEDPAQSKGEEDPS